jgi:hypothetical protein
LGDVRATNIRTEIQIVVFPKSSMLQDSQPLSQRSVIKKSLGQPNPMMPFTKKISQGGSLARIPTRYILDPTLVSLAS